MFNVRELIWDEISRDVNRSEVEELKIVIGTERIEKNEALKQELEALVAILQDYQAENDTIRDRIMKRPRLKDSQAKVFLKHQLKLLLTSVSDKIPAQFNQAKHIIDYVMSDSSPKEEEMIALTPRRRPSTAEMRPDSAASTYSAPGGLEIRNLTLAQVDKVKQTIQDAIDEEMHLLLDDIEFVQECLEMENDMIIQDTALCKSSPSIQELREFGQQLEQVATDDHPLTRLNPIPPPSKSDGRFERRTSRKSSSSLRSVIQDARDAEFLT